MRIQDSEIPDMEIGDVFYECKMGMNIEARVTSKPVETGGGPDGRRRWTWIAENTQTGKEISYAATEGMTHYGPRLYREPQYLHWIDGAPVFRLVGGET